MGGTLKIAFVNQPIDTILPPYQSSIGACTYGAACSLARSSEVIVYGIEDRMTISPVPPRTAGCHSSCFPQHRLIDCYTRPGMPTRGTFGPAPLYPRPVGSFPISAGRSPSIYKSSDAT